jgi:transcriptional regulator with XRE-family HTH domain
MVNKISELRKKKHITQAELAEMLNISKGYLSQLEIGVRSPSLKLLKQLSKIFSVPLDYLVFDRATLDAQEIPEAIMVFFRSENLSEKDLEELTSLFNWWKEQRERRK